MNKLRKPNDQAPSLGATKPPSRNQQIQPSAQYHNQHIVSISPTISQNHANSRTQDVSSSSFEAPKPRSSVEQYWAARALTAETLLSARTSHQYELKSFSLMQETKYTRQIAALTAANDARHARLEKLVFTLLGCLISLIAFLMYLVVHRNHQKSSKSNRWLPSHFTIPIFSPFTSVVEHETSVIGSKSIFSLVVVLAGLGYFVFRHWVAHARVPTMRT